VQTASSNYTVRKESDYYVAQSLQIDVSSFGNSEYEAIINLQEAVALYFDQLEITEHQNNIDLNQS
jgi:predicted RNase H-like HicB family nuclease